MIYYSSHKSKAGFTLIELLVVVAIIALLSSIIFASVNKARANARDKTRLQSMVALRNALELYFTKNGHYPVTNGTIFTSDSDTQGNFDNSQLTNWIPGLVADKDISVLPHDPNAGVPNAYCDPTSSWWGNPESAEYVYYSHDGTGYALASVCGAEAPINTGSPFFDTWLKVNNGFTDLHMLKMCVGTYDCNGGDWGYL